MGIVSRVNQSQIPNPVGSCRHELQTSTSLRDQAVSGGLWTGAQVVVNKVVSLGGTIAMMYLLLPAQYGLATLASNLLAAVTLLAPFTLSDVLLSRPSEADRLMGTAKRICLLVTAANIVMLVTIAPLASAHYENPALFGACIVMVLRPIVEVMLLGPQTRLRMSLRFKTLATIDALTQSLATVTGIAMAWMGAGYLSIVLPQIAFTAIRAFMYRRSCPAPLVAPSWLPKEARSVIRGYVLSGLGQYVHGGLLVSTPLLIGQFATEREVGLYSQAFSLSASMNIVVAVSMGLVLQPVFAQMLGDFDRQAAAFLRACRTIAAVAMPVCILQAALTPAAFHTLLPATWGGAIVMTQLLCLGQAFYFPVNPAMGLLKAQGRFGAFFAWQSVQLFVAVLAMWIVARLAVGSASIAIVSVAALLPLVSSPFGVWLSIRHRKSGSGGTLSIFLAPTTAAIVSIGPAYFATEYLLPEGATRDWTQLLVVPLVALFLYRFTLRYLAPAQYGEIEQIVRAAVNRIVPSWSKRSS
jgi:O-antigen/teichoic acid export membrane protein